MLYIYIFFSLKSWKQRERIGWAPINFSGLWIRPRKVQKRSNKRNVVQFVRRGVA